LEAITTSAIIIRKAAQKDVQAIADFNSKLAFETEGKTLDEETVMKGVSAVIHDPHKGFYIIAETETDGVQLLGQLLITFEWSDWRNQRFWWIQSVYVAEEFRNQRVFAKLYRYVVEMAKQRGDISALRLYVAKHNAPAKQAYVSLGLKQIPYELFEHALLSSSEKDS
jgi:GNAT superfamily N-acetyltransferase